MPGPVSKARSSPSRSDPGDIGDPADIDESDGTDLEARCQRAVIDGNQRRALPAGGDIVGTQIIDDGDAEPPRQERAVAELNGEPVLRAVEDGLSVKADKIDVGLDDADVTAESSRPRGHANR